MYDIKATDSLLTELSKHKIDSTAIKHLLQEGADPNAELNYKAGRYPALAQAIVRGNSDVVKNLIAAGANIKACLTIENEEISMHDLAMKVCLNSDATRGQKIISALNSVNPT